MAQLSFTSICLSSTFKFPYWKIEIDIGAILTQSEGDGMGKKLIEVALPLEAINRGAEREKSIPHGRPSTLHLWWARRPLAACRAVLFAQLVDDPSGYVDKLLDDPKIRKQAEADRSE